MIRCGATRTSVASLRVFELGFLRASDENKERGPFYGESRK